MRALVLSVSLFAIMLAGCEKPAVDTKVDPDSAVENTADDVGLKLEEVDAEGLKTVLASNDVALLEFTAEW